MNICSQPKGILFAFLAALRELPCVYHAIPSQSCVTKRILPKVEYLSAGIDGAEIGVESQ